MTMSTRLTFLDRLNLAWLDLKSRRRESKRWAQPVSAGKPVRAFYGLEHVPGASERAGGGIIKYQDLETIYPNTPQGANLVYLTSSALLPGAVYMARRAQAAGAVLVLNQNGVAYAGWHGRGWQEFNRPMKALLHRAAYVFYQSEFCKQGADRFLGPRQGPHEILYNAVDTQTFVPSGRQAPLQPLTLLLAGTHCHLYRVRSAVETIAELRRRHVNARLVIAGRNAWRRDAAEAGRELQRQCQVAGVAAAVALPGPYTQKEAVGLLQRADILLHTKYNDPCPRLAIEAMSCGLPVVYSASGGMPELVGTDAGIGVPAPLDWEQDHPPDPVPLADAVMAVAERWVEYSRAARDRAVTRFDVQPWLARHREVFESLIR